MSLCCKAPTRPLSRRGRQGKSNLWGFDLDPVSYQMVKDGKIDALVVKTLSRWATRA